MNKNLKHFILIGLSAVSTFSVKAQITFPKLLTRALEQSAELVSLKASRQVLQLEADKIKAENTSPKAYLSSDFLLAPYLNNQGQFISTNPANTAIGYDIGISNGGLYSLLFNAEMPLFNKQQVNHLLEQNQLEINRIDSHIKALTVELEHLLALQYLEALASQTECDALAINMDQLSQQANLTKTLTEHGLYRYIDYRLLKTTCTADSIELANAQTTLRLKFNQLLIACGVSDLTTSRLAGLDVQLQKNQSDTSVFVQNFVEDSLSAMINQKVFDDRYKPQLNVYANTGLNSTSIPYLGYHVGMSAGLQLTWLLYDGKQKQINHQQQVILMDQANRQRELKQNEIANQAKSFLLAIQSLETNISDEEKLQNEYSQILEIYNQELQKGEVGISEYLNFRQMMNQNRLTLENNKLERSKLIVEYNYWNH